MHMPTGGILRAAVAALLATIAESANALGARAASVADRVTHGPRDPWADVIEPFVEGRAQFTTAQLFDETGLWRKDRGVVAHRRVAAILRRLGFELVTARAPYTREAQRWWTLGGRHPSGAVPEARQS